MKPLSLTLQGFTGIRDGLGRDVIELDFEALCGEAQLVASPAPTAAARPPSWTMPTPGR